MFSYIKGTLEEISDTTVIVENNGIGYEIKVPTMEGRLPGIGSKCKLYTYMHVREDFIGLFGFLTKQEQQMFELLITVNGVGPKVALAILSTLDLEELKLAILSDDTKTISKTPGIGAKGAKKIILELKDKIDCMDASPTKKAATKKEDTATDVISMTVEALASLGYSNSEAYKAVTAVEDRNSMDVEALLKAALKKMI